MIWFFIGIVLVIILMGILLLFLHQKKGLSPSVTRKFVQKIRDTKSLEASHAILNAHKFFVAALSNIYQDKNLTAAQKISKVAHRFPNKSTIWRFHKLRNKIAHEVEIKVSKADAEKARTAFIRALNSITKK